MDCFLESYCYVINLFLSSTHLKKIYLDLEMATIFSPEIEMYYNGEVTGIVHVRSSFKLDTFFYEICD